MIRTVLSSALAATCLVLTVPAHAESPLEFIQTEAAEHEAAKPAKTKTLEARKVTARKAAATKTAKAKPAEPETLKEGRASTSSAPQGAGLTSLVARYADQHGVPQNLAHGVVMVESRYRPGATGPGGYIGLMQLSYRTAQGMGYSGSRAGLYDPATNLNYGMQYLGEAYRKAGGNMCGAVSKYQGGHGVRGVTKAGAVYCGKVKKYMAQRAPVDQQLASN